MNLHRIIDNAGKVVSSHLIEKLENEELIDFLPEIIPYRHAGSEISQGEVMERWKVYFVDRDIPFVETERKGVHTLWKIGQE